MKNTLNNKLIIGIDHGYGNMKTANHCFKTGIIASDYEPVFTKDVLEFDGKTVAVGEKHKEFTGDKITDDDFYLLTLAAVAMELQSANLTSGSIIIAAGLPLTWSAGQKESFRNYLMREKEVSFIFRKISYHIHISEVMIFPQGYASIVQQAKSLRSLSMVADIGNGTMNTLFMEKGRPQAGKMYTDKLGVHQCVLMIREAFMQKTQRELNDAIIDDMLKTGTADIDKEDFNIIQNVIVQYVKEVFRCLREHGYDEKTMTLYITGGGGKLVRNFRQNDPDRIIFIDDICANAKGYEYLAELKLRAAG